MIATLGTILFLPSALKNEAGSSLRSVLTFAMIIGVGTLMLRFTLSYLLVSRDDVNGFNVGQAGVAYSGSCCHLGAHFQPAQGKVDVVHGLPHDAVHLRG